MSGISSAKYLYYGVIPDMTNYGCSSGCGSSSNPLDNLSSVSSHELVEAITDPAVGLAYSNNAYPLAWYEPTYGEISDICNAQQASVWGANGKRVVVQRHWSNRDRACLAQPR